MNVLLCVHHGLDPDLGAPGVTIALAGALEDAGCEVELFGFDHAFGDRREGVARQLRFPWRVAAALRRRGRELDVVDASTGDAWLWASRGRPGGGERPALVTRSHGLEPIADERRRAEGGLSWRYPLYHGGWRLREVRRSLRNADACVLLNRLESEWVRDRLGVPEERLEVIRYGIGEHFHRAPEPEAVGEGPLRMAYVGSWIERKGTDTMAAALARLAADGVDTTLTVLGAGEPEAVLGHFPEAVRGRVQVVPRFANEALPELLAGHELLLLVSRFEGSSGSLIEGMACGLAPIATAVGSAPDIIEPGRNGVLVDVGDAAAVAREAARLAADRPALLDMRRAARETAGEHRWADVARRTIEVYERALATRSTSARKRAPTAGQL